MIRELEHGNCSLGERGGLGAHTKQACFPPDQAANMGILLGGGVGRLRESVTSRQYGPSSSMACGLYSAAAGRSDGYEQGSAFFVMTPFRHNVFVGMFS